MVNLWWSWLDWDFLPPHPHPSLVKQTFQEVSWGKARPEAEAELPGLGAEELSGVGEGREERMTLSKKEVFPGVKSYSKEKLTKGQISASLSFNYTERPGWGFSRKRRGLSCTRSRKKDVFTSWHVGGGYKEGVTEKKQRDLTSGCCQVILNSFSTRQDHLVTAGLMRPQEFQARAPCIQGEHVWGVSPRVIVQLPSPTFGKPDLKENITAAIVGCLFIFLRGSSKAG